MFRIPELADEAQHRPQVVHLDIVTHEDPIPPQQVLEEGHLHGLALDRIENGLVQVTGADPIVTRVVEPVLALQPGREIGLPHPGHAEQGDAFILPGAERIDGQLQDGFSSVNGGYRTLKILPDPMPCVE